VCNLKSKTPMEVTQHLGGPAPDIIEGMFVSHACQKPREKGKERTERKKEVTSTHLSSGLLASAVGQVGDRLVEGTTHAKTRRACGLVADVEVDGAHLINTLLAERVVDVDQLEVLADPAARVAHAGRGVVHAVARRQGELAVVEEISALAGVDKLIGHLDTAAALGILASRLASDESVPGIVGDVVGTCRRVDLENVQAVGTIGDLDTNVVAADRTRPVGNPVGVDLAAEDSNGGGVLLMGGDAGSAATLGGDGRDEGSRSGNEGGGSGEHHLGGVG
jgi:hypothetical protein